MRDFQIFVHVVQHGGSHSVSTKQQDGEYHVYIDENENRRYEIEPAAVTAHEIGHALGFEFDLPKHREMEFASSLFAPERTSAEIQRLDMNREIEAWSVARAMFKAEATGLGLHDLAHRAQIEHEERLKQFTKFVKSL